VAGSRSLSNDTGRPWRRQSEIAAHGVADEARELHGNGW
jgi:hypothetical protein